ADPARGRRRARRLDRGGLDRGEGVPGRADARAGRAPPRLWLRAPQGLFDARSHRRARAPRAVPRAPAQLPARRPARSVRVIRIRTTPEDFRVDEQPLYPASGAGAHTFVRVEK